MDFKNTLLTVKTPESQEQDQHLEESSLPSPDSSDFCRTSDQNPSVPAICGVTKGMTSFFLVLSSSVKIRNDSTPKELYITSVHYFHLST